VGVRKILLINIFIIIAFACYAEDNIMKDNTLRVWSAYSIVPFRIMGCPEFSGESIDKSNHSGYLIGINWEKPVLESLYFTLRAESFTPLSNQYWYITGYTLNPKEFKFGFSPSVLAGFKYFVRIPNCSISLILDGYAGWGFTGFTTSTGRTFAANGFNADINIDVRYDITKDIFIDLISAYRQSEMNISASGIWTANIMAGDSLIGSRISFSGLNIGLGVGIHL
jgi:hypothetical protein